ncbi:MAG: L-seryl-tRNA(Sec) selenium transferase [Steroidobacteraceae bacterium]
MARSGPRELPSVDRLLAQTGVTALIASAGRPAVVAAVRAQLGELRRLALGGSLPATALEPDALLEAIARRVADANLARIRPVINLSGIVLHSNLGRALLPDSAIEAVLATMRSPVDLEFDLESGRRGDRGTAIDGLLATLTGAEAATAVNNNAAAIVLTLAAIAKRREVLVSRGELIEIGGSFRLPDMMRAAGAKLIEVGTTNRTHLSDYERALCPRTALILKVHPSNFVLRGFTAGSTTRELAALARTHGVPLAVDLGSGALIDLRRHGLQGEPVVGDAVSSGADLVTFSGDKLLGGPQAGLIVGRRELIARLNRHPFKRAFRLGKLTLAALEAVLRLYMKPEKLAEQLPTLCLLTRPVDSIRAQAERLCGPLAATLGADFVVTAEPLASRVGSGAQPEAELPSHGLVVRRATRRGPSLSGLARSLRRLPVPVIGRLTGEALCLDLRCLDAQGERALLAELDQLEA